MSVEAQAWAIGQSTGNATRKLVLWGLANGADKHGVGAWPSVGTLADYAECDKRTAQRHVATLLEMGLIREGDQRMLAHMDPRRRPIVYDLAMDAETVERWRTEYAAGRSDTRRSHAALTGATGGDVGAAVRWGCPDNLSPQDSTSRGDNRDALGVTTGASRGDTAMSPKPSVEPSLEQGLVVRPGAPVREEDLTLDRYVSRCHAVFNRAQQENPTTAHRSSIFPGNQGASWDAAAGWFRDGIPFRVASAEIARITSEFVPQAANPGIGGLKYFDPPIRKAWQQEMARAAAAAEPLVASGDPPPVRGQRLATAATPATPRGRFRDA